MILTACAKQPAATPEPTKAPEPTAAPAFTGLKYEAPDCNYGGNMKALEAVDEFT